MITRDALRSDLLSEMHKEWEIRSDAPFPSVADDDDLFDTGVVDSLVMVQVIGYIETLLDDPIDFITEDPASFFTLGSMVEFVLRRVTTATVEPGGSSVPSVR